MYAIFYFHSYSYQKNDEHIRFCIHKVYDDTNDDMKDSDSNDGIHDVLVHDDKKNDKNGAMDDDINLNDDFFCMDHNHGDFFHNHDDRKNN